MLQILPILCLAVSPPSRAAELHISAAASLKDVLQEIGRAYQAEPRPKLLFNFAASSLIARQIQEGAPADLFLSADEEKMNQLERRGLIRSETRTELLSNRLVVVVPTDSLLRMKSAADLKGLRRIALAEPATVPAGIHAREYLQAEGLWDELRDAIIPTENVRAALAAAEAGNVDAAIVYRTDAAISRRVKVAFTIPYEDTRLIVYVAALLKDSKHPAAARRFLEHLQSPGSARIFERHGFIHLSPE